MKKQILYITALVALTGCATTGTIDSRLNENTNESEVRTFNNLNIAAQDGRPDAQFLLAQYYRGNRTVKQNDSFYLYWLTRSAKQRYADSQYELAKIYYRNKNYPMAALWGVPAAMNGKGTYDEIRKLGELYDYGIGVSKDKKLASKLYKLADGDILPDSITPHKATLSYDSMLAKAQAGEIEYQADLGNFLFYSKRYAEAEKWLTLASSKGHPVAQNTLGILYSSDHGAIKKNPSKSISLYRKSAEQGFSTGQVNLGLLYGNGRTVEQNSNTARDWFKKAALQGDSEGQKFLGYSYAKTDLIKLYTWLKISSLHGGGSEEVQTRIRKLESTLNKDQIKDADRIAREWRASL